jgi:hypothetical protein
MVCVLGLKLSNQRLYFFNDGAVPVDFTFEDLNDRRID